MDFWSSKNPRRRVAATSSRRRVAIRSSACTDERFCSSSTNGSARARRAARRAPATVGDVFSRCFIRRRRKRSRDAKSARSKSRAEAPGPRSRARDGAHPRVQVTGRASGRNLAKGDVAPRGPAGAKVPRRIARTPRAPAKSVVGLPIGPATTRRVSFRPRPRRGNAVGARGHGHGLGILRPPKPPGEAVRLAAAAASGVTGALGGAPMGIQFEPRTRRDASREKAPLVPAPAPPLVRRSRTGTYPAPG